MEIKAKDMVLDEKKKKKPYDSMTITTGNPQYNIDMFNKMLTGKAENTHTKGILNGTFKNSEAEAAAKAVGTIAAPSPDGGNSVDFGGTDTAGGSESAADGAAGGVSESLDLHEDKIFASKMGGYVELPSQIKIIPQKDIESFISKIEPEEIFTVGYITPIYFYKKLLDKFTLVKCTEMIGYTGVDYVDTNLNTVGQDAAKIAKAKDQIANPTVGFNGYVKSDIAGMRKKYGDVNKTVNQEDKVIYEIDPTTGKTAKDADKKPIVKEIVKNLRTILFYPITNSKPRVKYFIDLHDGKEYMEISKEFLANTLYDKVLDIIARDTHNGTISNEEDLTDNERTFLGSVKAKAEQIIATDNQTADGVTLSQTGTNNVKPNVRALYTNQIYYLESSNFNVTTGNTDVIGKALMEQKLEEGKRYVRRYYMKPQNKWLSNKDEVLKALIDHEDEDCVIYTLINQGDTKDQNKLNNEDVIYYYEDGILYDKNHVRIMDYDLAIKHEEERPQINPETTSDARLKDIYTDRMTGVTNLEESNEFNLVFEDVHSESVDDKCCICGDDLTGYGNNAEPYKSGRCCDACNLKFVIPARLAAAATEKEVK